MSSESRAQLVADGTWRLVLPLPFPELPSVNVYALECPQRGLVLIDAGWDSQASAEALEDALDQAGFVVEDIRAVLLTHAHPDHCGLVPMLQKRSSAKFWMEADEAAWLRRIPPERGTSYRIWWLQQAGVSPSNIEAILEALVSVAKFRTFAPDDVEITPFSDLVISGRRLRPIRTPGHSPGHTCFLDRTENILFSGDHVLPDITPNVGYYDEEHPDPLGDFLASCDALRGLAPDAVLPGHGGVFTQLDARLEEVSAHHASRLETVTQVVDAGATTVWEVARGLGWLADDAGVDYMSMAALGEAWAHLLLLEHRGRVASGLHGAARHWRSTCAGGSVVVSV